MRHLAPSSRSIVLLLWLSSSSCTEGSSDEGEATATLTGPTGTSATGGATGDSTGDSTAEPPGSTGPATDTTGPGPQGSSDDDSGTSETSAGGEPGDWLLTVDRGSSPPRLIRAGLTGGAIEVCTLAASVDYTSLVFMRDGTLYGLNAAQNRIDVINPCNCSFQIVGPTSLGPIALGLADAGASEEGLLGLDPALDALVRVDPTTGLATVVGPLGYLFEGSAIAWSDALGQPYAVEASNDYLYTVDPVTGAGTPTFPLMPGVDGPGLAVHPNDDALYLCDGNSLYGLNPATGVLTEIGPLGLQGACRTLAAPQTAIACIDAL